jgi:DNA-binding NarL/FixJ family response regulator
VDGAQYISSAPDLYRADAIVWDLGWDAAEPLGLLAGLTGSGPPAVVLMADEDRSTEAWDAGASGVLPRDASLSTLMSALVAVAHGLTVAGPELAPLPQKAVGDSPPTPRAEVTPRELDVLNLMAEGLPNKIIATRLDISEHTVKFHVNSVLGKLGAHSSTEAVTRATRLGLIAL